MMTYRIMDGNEACATVSYQFTEVAGIYPITPASPMSELTDTWSGEGRKNYFGSPVKVVEMQSEAGAAGMVHGSLQAGCLTTTYTASQGLLLMIPNMYKIAGELLPCVIHVAARSLSSHALSIFGDHQDIYAARMTGFAMLASSSVQQVMDLTAVAHLATVRGRVPFLHFFDGFRTSHELDKVRVIDLDALKGMIDEKALEEFRERSLNPSHPVTRGTAQNDDIYFQSVEVRNQYYDQLPDVVMDYMKQINEITGEDYRPFNYYGAKDATNVIVAMGSVCETIKETIDFLLDQGEKVGLIEVHLYRPFSMKYFLDVLPDTVEKIAVLDRTKESGSAGEPLYLDVVGIINQSRKNIQVFGGRYGLSSKNTAPRDIAGVYEFLKKKPFHNFTIGIVDDVTHLSVSPKEVEMEAANAEFLIYGYGSDGMVSACKDLMKITGNYSNAYVQGYFQYDSKKSGGVTKSHLRFSKHPIRSAYYVEHPSLVMCTKESYLAKYKMLEGIRENGIFILVTSKKEDVSSLLSNHDKKILLDKNVRFYVVDAMGLASKVGLKNKISSIMETILFKVGHIIDFDFAVQKIEKSIEDKFSKKGGDIASKNIEAIREAVSYMTEISSQSLSLGEETKDEDHSMFDVIASGRGDTLKVSSFLPHMDGTYEPALSRLEKRSISEHAPQFLPENCIQCNMCSFVCPHAVIRPFLLDEEEVEKAPSSLKKDLVDANIKGFNYKYTIGISLPDCTGCQLCANICPGKKGKKALMMEDVQKLKETKGEDFAYLFTHVSEKKPLPLTTVKGSQFARPKFEFSGACAGCGETAYLRLLTQLFGDRLVIANATGCSSIYSASLPTTAYSVPWANSLFEDNAEFGFGMVIADKAQKMKIQSIIEDHMSELSDEEIDVYSAYLEEVTEETSKALYDMIDTSPIEELKEWKDSILKKSIWCVGGDGWAYDIGFSGIDHVLASGEDINLLVLDTEVYSNTGGQSSKSSKIGSIAKFTSKGKQVAKKDLARIALTYPSVYVGSIAIGGNMQQAVKVLTEAEAYPGPSIVFAYAPCIAQGILTGMESTVDEEKKAVETGYYPLFHYQPETGIFELDSKPDFNRYFEFIAGEDRYRMLKKINPEKYRELLEQNKINAEERYHYYESLAEQTKKEKMTEDE